MNIHQQIRDSVVPFSIILLFLLLVVAAGCLQSAGGVGDAPPSDENGAGNGNGNGRGNGDNGNWTCPRQSCECNYGDSETCYTGPAGTAGVGICRAGTRNCNEDGKWGPCWGQVLPLDEEECDGRDSTCNGVIDDGCPCATGESRDCYSGDPSSLNVGECRAGTQYCVDGFWGDCEGQVLPQTERCDGLDNDCTGEIDNGCNVVCKDLPDNLIEDCAGNPTIDHRCCCILDPQSCRQCVERSNQPCYTGPAGTGGVGQCVGGLRDCVNGVWTECRGQVLPADEEICGDGIDNTCNGLIDEGCFDSDWCEPGPEQCDGFDYSCTGNTRQGCPCALGQEADCYIGPPEYINVGACVAGKQECISIGDSTGWGPCEGSVLPQPERCDDIDHSCDGNPWPVGCCIPDPDCVDPVTGREVCCNGADSNCNGIIDYGLRNACGLCPGEPCWIEDFPDPDPIDGGWDCSDCDLDGAGPGDPANPDSLCDPDQLCLDRTRYNQPYIWIARTGENRIQRINTQTFETELYVPTTTTQSPGDTTCKDPDEPCFGWSPSRTAVATDGSVWVGFRGCRDNLNHCGNAHLPEYGNASRISPEGELICRADVTAGTAGSNHIAVRAVTLDNNDHAWIGSWQQGKIYQYAGDQVDNSHPDGVPRCVLLQEVDLVWGGQRSHAYGAAVNSRGELWIATLGHGAVLQIDTNSGQILTAVNLPAPAYGLAVDLDDNVWFGVWNTQGGVMRLDANTHVVQHITLPSGHACASARTRGVAIDFDGNIWVAAWDCSGGTNYVLKYEKTGVFLGAFPVDGNPLGMAVANDGRVWSINFGNSTATVLEPDGTSVDTLGRLQSMGQPYTYSDMTGLQHRLVLRQEGFWRNVWDSAWLDARWETITWEASQMPAGTEICLSARAANSRSALAVDTYSQQVCSNNLAGSVDLSNAIGGQPLQGRYIEVMLRLHGSGDESPIVDKVSVHWERP